MGFSKFISKSMIVIMAILLLNMVVLSACGSQGGVEILKVCQVTTIDGIDGNILNTIT